jgi:catechol 2,3-dioxygenase
VSSPFLDFGPIHLAVGDVERARRWYEAVLGLAPSVLKGETDFRRENDVRGELELGAGRSLGLGVPGACAPLIVLHEELGARRATPGGRPGLYHMAFLLPERAALGRFLAHLVGLEISPGAADHGVSEALYLEDADGLGIEVYVDRPFDAWPRTPSGGLQMWTRPLDGGALISTAKATPEGLSWSGVPLGTKIGHLHLHTPSLEASEAFYRERLGFERSVGNKTSNPNADDDIPGARFVAAPPYHHHLGLNLWARNPSPAGHGEARLLAWEAHVRGASEEGDVRSVSGHRTRPSLSFEIDPSGVRVRQIVAVAESGLQA